MVCDTRYLQNEFGDRRFFYVFNLVLSFSTCSQSFYKICVWEVLGANVLKNLVHDLALHQSPVAQWLERPTGIWKVMRSTSVGGSENSLSEYFDLSILLHYLHFTQVTSLIINHLITC